MIFLNKIPSWFAILSLVALGALLRVYHIGTESLWLDEMTSISVGSTSLKLILFGGSFDNHTPPLYYIILHGWFQLFSADEVSLRALSVVFDLLNIALVFAVSREQASKQIAIFTTLLFATSSFAIYYAQDGRMYSLLLLLTLSIYALMLRFLDESHPLGKFYSVAVAIVTAMGLYTHYYFAIFLLGIVIWLIFFEEICWSRKLRLLIPIMLGGIMFLPWIGVILGLVESGGQSFRKFHSLVLPYTAFRFVGGYGIMPITSGNKSSLIATVRENIPQLIAAMSVVLFIGGAGLLEIAKRHRQSFRRNLFIIIFVPLAAWLISFKLPMLSERYLIVVFPLFLVVLAAVIEIRLTTIRLPLMVALMGFWAFALSQHFFNIRAGKAEWRNVGTLISDSGTSNLPILVNPNFVSGVLSFYLTPTARKSVLPIISDKFGETSFNPDTVESYSGFWLVEDGVANSIRDAIPTSEFQLERSQSFEKENGIWVGYYTRQAISDGLQSNHPRIIGRPEDGG